jgi:methylated-DNA-[protein]-cysteine S-methyltransferase
MATRKLSVSGIQLEDFDALVPAPACVLGVRTEADSVSEIVFLPESSKSQRARSAVAQEFCRQLALYLDDPKFVFDVPINTGGTEFQRAVWSKMRAIPPGQTLTYGEVASGLNSSARAVGQACGANRLPIVIPCHRIVASHGMGGFAHRAAGFPLNVKRWLLTHERSR